jgi:hypothetical protein
MPRKSRARACRPVQHTKCTRAMNIPFKLMLTFIGTSEVRHLKTWFYAERHRQRATCWHHNPRPCQRRCSTAPVQTPTHYFIAPDSRGACRMRCWTPRRRATLSRCSAALMRGRATAGARCARRAALLRVSYSPAPAGAPRLKPHPGPQPSITRTCQSAIVDPASVPASTAALDPL